MRYSLFGILLACSASIDAESSADSATSRYLDSLYFQCYHYLQSNHKLMAPCVEFYLNESEKNKDSIHIAYALDLSGQSAYLKDQIDSALNVHLKALALFEQIEDFEGASISHYNISTLYTEMGRLDKALHHIYSYRSIDKAEGMKYSSDLFFFSDLAYLYQKQGADVFALRLLEQNRYLLDSFREVYPFFEAFYLCQLAECYIDLDSLASAYDLLRRAELLSQSDSTRATMSYIRFVQAQYHLKTKDYNLALKHINEGIILDSVYGTRFDLAMAWISRAEIYVGMGDYEKAARDLRRADDYLSTRQYRYTGTGDLLRVQLKLDSARQDYKSAFATFYELDSFNRAYKTQNYSALVMQMELDHQEEFNRNLEKENKLQAEKLLWRKALAYSLFFIVVLMAILAWRELKRRRLIEELNRKLQRKNKKNKRESQIRRKQNERIAEKNAQLIEMTSAKDRLLSILSHELQQPFFQMRQVLQILDDSKEDLSPDMQNITEALGQSVAESTEVVQQLLIWTKTQFDGYSLNQEKIQLEAAVKMALLELQLDLKSKALSVDLLDCQNATVFFDPDHLRFVLRNILKNAIKFSTRGKAIKIRSDLEEEYVVLAIEDFGLGMDQATVDRIMAGTNRQSSKGSENERGFGLGLRIVQDFLRENQAKLEVHSVLGKGSIFKVSMPIMRSTTSMPGF